MPGCIPQVHTLHHDAAQDHPPGGQAEGSCHGTALPAHGGGAGRKAGAVRGSALVRRHRRTARRDGEHGRAGGCAAQLNM